MPFSFLVSFPKKCIHEITIFFNKVSDPTFHVSMGDLGEEASPYNCFIECLRQNIILPGKPLTIGLSQGGICLCGHENSKILKSNNS